MKILVIQQKRIGDVLTSTIISNALRKHFPDAQIDFMCYANAVPVLEGNPNISNIIVLDHQVRKSYSKLLTFMLGIRNKNYNVVIDAYSKLETNLISSFSGAPTRISYKKGYSDVFYNHNIKRLRNGTPSKLGLAIENRLRLLSPLISEPITDYKPKIFLSEAEIRKAEKKLDKYGISTDRPLFMIGIVGSEWYKTYPLEKMAELLDLTVEKTNANLLFNYIPDQASDAKKLYSLCNSRTQSAIHLECYATSLRKSLALLSRCDALIGNEGGAVNMAKALDVPTFSLFSPSVDKETWQIFEDDPKNVSVHLKDLKPEIYERHDAKYIKEHTFEFFDEYPISLIKEKLADFLERIS